MARKFIPDEASPFYPPRAGWTSWFFHFSNRVRRRLALDRLRMPRRTNAKRHLAAFVVPGLAVYLRGPRLWGQAALWACGMLLLFYFAWLGHPAANLAFGLLLSIHATGFVYYCNPLMAERPFRARLTFTFLVLLAMTLALYWPARGLIQNRLLTPLNVDGRIIVVQRVSPVHAIQRGEWVAYSLGGSFGGEAHNGGAVWALGGAGLGPVLAVGGDQVSFSADGFTVNGFSRLRLPHMPADGAWQVPEKHWFIWPNLAISGHGNVNEQTISSTYLALADVAPDQILGQPLRHWFWREQTLP
jgi:hypothetical protein